MTYDPFARGPYSVGVRSGQLTDAAADHLHFGDSLLVQLELARVLGLLPQQTYDELLATLETCSQEQAQDFTRALALAHLHAVLKHDLVAEQFLAGDPILALSERGVDAMAWPAP